MRSIYIYIYIYIYTHIYDISSLRVKAVLVWLIQFRDTSKGTDKSVRSLHSVSPRRKQQPQNAPQGRTMFLGTTARDQLQNTTVTSRSRLVTKRQTASIRRTAASQRGKKAATYPSHTMFEVFLPYLTPGDVRPQEWWMKNCQRFAKKRSWRYRGTIAEFAWDRRRKSKNIRTAGVSADTTSGIPLNAPI